MKTEDEKGKHSKIVIRQLILQPIFINARSFWRDLQQFVMQRQKSGFAPIFLIFLICTNQGGWQGYGNMTKPFLDAVFGYINTNISQYTDTSDYDTFNTGFSNELNRRWDPAWNIITIQNKNTLYDTVLYGYAFNNHWMWYNNYYWIAGSGNFLSFVIWKDYNCQGWKTVGKNGQGSSLPSLTQIKANMIKFNIPSSDLWNAAKFFSEKLQSDYGIVNSLVLCQYVSSVIYGRICTVGDNYFYTMIDASFRPFYVNGAPWGNLLFFQTR